MRYFLVGFYCLISVVNTSHAAIYCASDHTDCLNSFKAFDSYFIIKVTSGVRTDQAKQIEVTLRDKSTKALRELVFDGEDFQEGLALLGSIGRVMTFGVPARKVNLYESGVGGKDPREGRVIYYYNVE